MTCKTFIDLNRAKKEAEEEQMDPLKKLGAMLQLEFDELVGEKFYRAINNSRMIDAGVVMSKVEEEIQKERDTFVLENPEFIPNKLIEGSEKPI
jgi:alpha-amylase/alpha-mannosidase (GH57 family)